MWARRKRDDDAGRRSAGGGAAMVGATEAAAGPDVDSRGGDSARSLGGAVAEGGACRARGQRRFSWARRSRVRATSSLAATREVLFTGLVTLMAIRGCRWRVGCRRRSWRRGRRGASERAAPGRGGGHAGRCSCRGCGARKVLPEVSARGWETHRRGGPAAKSTDTCSGPLGAEWRRGSGGMSRRRCGRG